jgi:hypothetical protein
VGVLVMRVVNVSVRVLEHLVVVPMIVPLGQVKPHAGPMRLPARKVCQVRGSWSARAPASAPTKGGVEKYAPVRAVPRRRRASTNRTRLVP